MKVNDSQGTVKEQSRKSQGKVNESQGKSRRVKEKSRESQMYEGPYWTK